MVYSAYGATPLHTNVSAGRRSVNAKLAFGMALLYTLAVISMHENEVFSGVTSTKAVAFVDTNATDAGNISSSTNSTGVVALAQTEKFFHFVAFALVVVTLHVVVPAVAIAIGAATVSATAAVVAGGLTIAGHHVAERHNHNKDIEGIFPEGKFGLVGGKDQKFCADEGGSIKCNRAELGAWEKFELEKTGVLAYNQYGIKGGKDGKWCANDGDDGVRCNRGSIGSWEKFQIEIIDKAAGKVAIKSLRNNKYCADEGSRWICNRDSPGGWEWFVVIDATPEDCEGAFGDWTDCSKTCAGGNKTREYSVQVEAVRGGKVCPHTDTCYDVEVGKGPMHGRTVDVKEGYQCPNEVSKDNWLNDETYGDTFEITQEGTKITAVRTDTGDRASGWGMPLRISCCKPHMEMATCNTEKCEHVGLKRSVWDDLNGKKAAWHDANGNLVHVQPGALDKGSEGFAVKPTANKETTDPTLTCVLKHSFEAPVDTVSDGGQMVSGNFIAPTTGDYSFSLAADDGGILWFGESAATKVKIATVKSYVGSPGTADHDSTQTSTREYFEAVRLNEKSNAVSAPISLTAGQAYYIQAVEVNRQGRDAMSVSVKGGPFVDEIPIPATHAGTTVLSYLDEVEEDEPACFPAKAE